MRRKLVRNAGFVGIRDSLEFLNRVRNLGIRQLWLYIWIRATWNNYFFDDFSIKDQKNLEHDFKEF